jgi:hypothetical protein
MRLKPQPIGTKSRTIVIFAHLIQAASNLPIDASALESSISALERAISALESEVKALESSSAPLERSLPWATAVVVLGLLMEFWVIWREHRDEWDAFWLGIVRLADRPSTRKYVVELLSVSFITLGVFCEFAIGIKIASLNNALRGKSAELRSKNADLRIASDHLVALINKEAQHEKLARIEIEERVEWRRLSDRQIADIGQALRVFAGRGAYFVYPLGDEEAGTFMEDIKAALCAANWRMLGSISQIQGQTIGPEPPSACSSRRIRPPAIGVIVVYKLELHLHPTENSLRGKAALALVHELSKRGFDAVPQPDIFGQPQSLGVEDIEVRVRHRPEGPQGEAKLRHEKNSSKQTECQ